MTGALNEPVVIGIGGSFSISELPPLERGGLSAARRRGSIEVGSAQTANLMLASIILPGNVRITGLAEKLSASAR